MDSAVFLQKLWRVVGFRAPSQLRDEELYRAEVAARHDAGEESLGGAAVGASEVEEWCARRGIRYGASVGELDYEDARAYCEALDRFVYDFQGPAVEKARERYAAVAGDAARSGAARRTLAKEQAILDYAERELDAVWGIVHRPVVNGPKDSWDVSSLLCRCGCGRLFSDAQAKAQAFSLHPLCQEELRRAASSESQQTFGQALAERFPF